MVSLVLVRLVHAHLILDVLVRGPHVGIVVPLVVGQLALLELNGVCADLVQEGPVVTDDDDRVTIGL